MRMSMMSLLIASSLVACADTPDDGEVGDRLVEVIEGASTTEPLASYREPGDGAAPRCWVVLDWCASPTTGNPQCHATNCSPERAYEACVSLAGQYCGYQPPN